MLNSERQPENEFTSFCQAQTNAVHFCQTKPIKRKHSHAPCFRHTIFRLPFSAAKGSLKSKMERLLAANQLIKEHWFTKISAGRHIGEPPTLHRLPVLPRFQAAFATSPAAA